MLASYRHFLDFAASAQWDEAELDLRADALSWPALEEPDRRRVMTLVAGFRIGEASVARELGPFGDASSDPEAAACFRGQAVDEARHARFFDRVANEVLRVPGEAPAARQEHLRRLLDLGFVDLFEVRLPELARELARGDAELRDAVGLYHMVLEGIVLTAGQLALGDLLERLPLPGLRAGLELVVRDERWHVGFGARCLQDAGASGSAVDAILSEGEAAIGAWGEAIDQQLLDRVAAVHRRRLRAAGLGDVPAPELDGVPAAA